MIVGLSVYELVRMVKETTTYWGKNEIGEVTPAVSAGWFSITWVVFLGLAGIFGFFASLTVTRSLAVVSTVLQTAVVAPITLQMLFYSLGKENWYFGSVSMFCFISGIAGMVLCINLNTENKAQEARRALSDSLTIT